MRLCQNEKLSKWDIVEMRRFLNETFSKWEFSKWEFPNENMSKWDFPNETLSKWDSLLENIKNGDIKYKKNELNLLNKYVKNIMSIMI